ncbi:double-strand break repair protein MRE11 [Condylostylus longicornis]|uniref:double-strand break repair protein MRE11 n=1 Tax=Condylostylus longicornis TaxID=2530218 RepID=UPI00244E5125|nr:double-strand break repair protein MRE11 [Condylostylus longicornis]
MPPNELGNEEEVVNEFMKIMIATDNHLGYLERDDIRGDDSFVAFEEILELAVENDVDFILLGGDLFHDAVPSQNALYKCMRLLRRVTFGDKPISLEFLSDQSVNFVDALNQTVNYEDPNLNISIPIFSIHGNHDDPSGFAGLSSLDILSTNGLVNYFGKSTDSQKIIINPILLKKGETQLALYGLSHIRDVRLARLFRDSKVVMETPPESTGKWFNLMVLHQNRADRGPTNYLPENILPNFLDLVIWGHEHDCRIVPEVNDEQEFYVCQPGSSVATSLSEGEARPKHCAILKIYKSKFDIERLPLKTVRPFIFKSIDLAEYIEEYHLDEGGAEEKVTNLARKIIEEMINESQEQISGHPKQPTLPLIRLRMVYTDEQQMFNTIRFGQQYNQRIANSNDCVLFKRGFKKLKENDPEFDKSAMEKIMETEDLVKVEDIVERYFEEADDQKKLQIFPTKILSEMCYRLAERNDIDAAETIVNLYKEKALSHLMEKLPNEEETKQELTDFKENKANENYESILNSLEQGLTKKLKIAEEDDVIDDDEVMFVSERDPLDETDSKRNTRASAKTTSTRGKGRGKAAPASKKMELDVSTVSKKTTKPSPRSKQPSIKDSFSDIPERVQPTQSRTSRRQQAKRVIYEIEDSD